MAEGPGARKGRAAEREFHTQGEIEFAATNIIEKINNNLKDSNNLIVNISEGEKLKLKKVNIEGNTHFTDKKLFKIFQNTK